MRPLRDVSRICNSLRMTLTDLLSNKLARQHFLDHHRLRAPPLSTTPQSVLGHLNFVQVDSINTMARAHDLILWSRQQSYRPTDLRKMVDINRSAFEGWTHDASILPIKAFPHWQHKFTRDGALLQKRWKLWHRGDFLAQTQTVLDQIASQGPVGSGDVGTQEKRGGGGWWDWHPSKTALEYLWRTGRIAVTRREGFRKIYDLVENVIPNAYLHQHPSPDDSTDWACRSALQAMGFATEKEIAEFCDFVTILDVTRWLALRQAEGEIRWIHVEAADGTSRLRAIFTQDWERLQTPLAFAPRVRILSPFDPALRNRQRAQELFGFSYRIEVFVPAAKRVYGYYVFPMLEGDKLIGRIEVKTNRPNRTLDILGIWPEATTGLTPARKARIQAELTRLCGLAGCEGVSGLEVLARA